MNYEETDTSTDELTLEEIEHLADILEPEDLALIVEDIKALNARNNPHPMDCQRTLKAIEKSIAATKH